MKKLLTVIAAALALACFQGLAQDYIPTPVTVSTEKVRLNGKIYLSHVVLERQTIFGICKAYGITEQQLYEANPSLVETGLQTGAILLIPYLEMVASENPVRTHKVRWFEDIDDIAAQYDVSVEELMKRNGLTSRKLKKGQVLVIPVAAGAVVPAAAPKEESAPEEASPEAPADTLAVVPVPVEQPAVITPKDQAEFALLLPLKAASEDVSEINMDFYSGVLLALKDLEEEGVKASAHVYDLYEGIPPVEELVKNDFILGPVASRDLEAILQRVDSRVPVISPLDQRAAGLSEYYHPFVQVPAPADCQYEDLAQWLKEDLQEEGEKVLLITEKGASSVTAAVAIRSALARKELSYDILNYAIAEGRELPDTLSRILLNGKENLNRVVVASENEAFTGDVVRNLGIMQTKGCRVVMYAPSRARTFETIDGSALHDAALHICTAYYADYKDPRTEHFVQSYRALFRTEPSQFAFQGYDTARYFVTRVLHFGKDWASFADNERNRGLHTDFLLKPDEFGNLRNSAVRRVVFETDYTTTLQQ